MARRRLRTTSGVRGLKRPMRSPTVFPVGSLTPPTFFEKTLRRGVAGADRGGNLNVGRSSFIGNCFGRLSARCSSDPLKQCTARPGTIPVNRGVDSHPEQAAHAVMAPRHIDRQAGHHGGAAQTPCRSRRSVSSHLAATAASMLSIARAYAGANLRNPQ